MTDELSRTLVDLPGLVHVAITEQGEKDKQLIFYLVKTYMQNPRTIILAVVSAKNDRDNQVILADCKKIDTGGCRTMGIITKPDAITKRDIPNWIDLAQNKQIYLEKGWHMLRNRGPEEMDFSFEQRNKTETEFFSKGRFDELPKEFVGVESLRERLSTLLFGHLVQELPSVKTEMELKLRKTIKELEQLGKKRTTTAQQRIMLTNLAQTINSLLKSAITGYYADEFFGKLDMDAAVDSDENVQRFRAVIHDLNFQFAKAMRRQGHKYALGVGPGDADIEVAEEQQTQNELASMGDKDFGSTLPKPQTMNRKEAIDWVRQVLKRSRGNELPGNFNPMLISRLFWDQSAPWEGIALEHIASVFEHCEVFVYKVIRHVAPAEFVSRLASQSIDKALQAALKDSEKELGNLIKDKKSEPMTYDEVFTTILQKKRQRKHARVAQDATKNSTVQNAYSNHYRSEVDPVKLEQALSNSIEQNMDKYSAEEALDNARAYYKVRSLLNWTRYRMLT